MSCITLQKLIYLISINRCILIRQFEMLALLLWIGVWKTLIITKKCYLTRGSQTMKLRSIRHSYMKI